MTRPAAFFIEWTEGDEHTYEVLSEDYASRRDARLRAREVAEFTNQTIPIFRRVHIKDVTPAGDPPGLLWEYQTELVAEIG